MVYRKIFKNIYPELVEKDEVREMMIASANYPNNALVSNQEEENFTNYPLTAIIPTVISPKKKRRLDNLTADEKLLRKKLKNREAAQTSRDKKKAYLNNLETMVKMFREQNELLQKRVELLTGEKEVLKRKNEKLEKMIERVTVPCNCINEPAELNRIPLQWDHPLLHVTVILPLLLLLLMKETPKIRLWIWTILIGLIISRTHQIWMNWQTLPIIFQRKLLNWRLQYQRVIAWWGPRQKSWTPIMSSQNQKILPNLVILMMS